MFIGSEQVTKQGNNKYTHITLYVGVTIKEFHLQWKKVENWSKITINVGNIHPGVRFFSAIWSYISGSTLEEILYQ